MNIEGYEEYKNLLVAAAHDLLKQEGFSKRELSYWYMGCTFYGLKMYAGFNFIGEGIFAYIQKEWSLWEISMPIAWELGI